MDQQGSPCYDSLKWLSGIYDNKVNSVGQMDSKKLAALVLLYVFIIGFPASPFHSNTLELLQKKIAKKITNKRFYDNTQFV